MKLEGKDSARIQEEEMRPLIMAAAYLDTCHDSLSLRLKILIANPWRNRIQKLVCGFQPHKRIWPLHFLSPYLFAALIINGGILD